MKLILILLLISNISFAKTYANKNEISCDTIGKFYSGPKAKSLCGKDCIEVKKGFNCNYSKIIPDTQMKTQDESCLDESDCQSKLESLVCEKGQPIKNIDQLEVYCTWLRLEHVGIDQSKKDAHDALESQENSEKQAIEEVYKDMSFGKELYAKIVLMNKKSGLTKAQRKQMRKDLKSIKEELFDGNICDAKSEILLLAISPPAITQVKKDSVVALINEYKVCQ